MLSKDNINKIKEAIIIEGPDDVLNSNDENRPNNTDNNPPIIENNTIFWGLSEISNSKLSKYLSNFSDNSGMKYSKYNLEFFGLCKKCKSK